MKRIAVLLAATLAALLLAEGLVRWVDPPAVAKLHARLEDPYALDVGAGLRTLRPDPELGFRPEPGGRVYGEHGARHNRYALAKPAGVERVLFLGDSVTFRGKVLEGVAAAYGRAGREYWNAGVEAYSTFEEALYYESYVAELDEDHTLLLFHPNDAFTTPIVFTVGEDDLAVYLPGRGSWRIDADLARASFLYALWKGRRLVNLDPSPLVGARARCREGLRRIRDEAARRGARLTVLRLPIAAPPEAWTVEERAGYDLGGELCAELGVASVDLVPALRAALADGLEDLTQVPGDPWHPSAGLGLALGAWLRESGFEL